MIFLMKTKAKLTTESPRERIMNVAMDLFYQQGFRATGINEVIEKSGVAKATFYNHFPSKDDLGLAYLKGVVEKEIASLDEALQNTDGALERFLLAVEWLKPWLDETNFRGCAFLHTVAEIPDPKSPLRKQGKILYDNVRLRIRELATELIASSRKKYGHLDPEQLTNAYMVVFAGAIALSEIYHANWPVEHALDALRSLLGETTG